MRINELELTQYVPPDFLAGRCDKTVYYKWLKVKANTLIKRDRKRGKPYAFAVDQSVYMKKIHEAVKQCGERDGEGKVNCLNRDLRD